MILFEKIKNFQNELSDSSSQTRSEALTSLQNVGLPHRRVEAWKYTNITQRLDKDFSLKTSKNFTPNISFDCEVVRISNGKVLDQKDFLEIKEISLENFNQDLNENDALYLYNLATSEVCYEISFKTSPSKPVVFYHLNDEETSGKSLSSSFKLSIKANQNIELLEVFETTTANFVSLAQNIKLEANAKLFHTVLTLGNEENSLHLYTNTDLKKDSEYHNLKVLIKNSLVRNEIKVHLLEPGSHAEVHGLYALNFKEHADTYSQINHHAPHTTSSQLYKGVMANESRGVFTGLVKIDKKAQLVSSNQLNKNLLLSKKAHANSRPQLEIFADDVKCSHGSTTGQMSPEELFYFVSRGIKPMRARKLLSQAFAFDVILKIKNKAIQNYIQNIFTESYQGLEDVNND